MGEDRSGTTVDKENTEEMLTLEAVGADSAKDLEDKIIQTEVSSDQSPTSVTAQTHTKKRSTKSLIPNIRTQKRWQRNLSFIVGVFALVVLAVSGALSQYYKEKTLPNVVVAGVNSGAKTADELKSQLDNQYKQLKITIQAGEKKLEPKF